MPFRRILTFLIVLILSASGQGIIEPPYGLKWGDSPEKLIAWSSRHSLDVNISLPGDQPSLRIVRVQARKGFLPGSQDSAVEGRFLAGKLYEFTVHYSDPDANSEQIQERFIALKRKFTLQFGEFTANQQQRQVADQYETRTQSFHREPVKGLFLMLVFTSVEDLVRKSKEARYSAIYRNDNLRQEIEKLLNASPKPTDGR